MNILFKLFFAVVSIWLAFGLMVALSSASPCIVENRAAWVCYEHSVNYEKLNPSWDCITISQNRYFKGVSHMVNYQLEGENLNIHDEFYGLDYTIYDYKNSGFYFHFWLDVKPVKNYRFLWDNSPQN